MPVTARTEKERIGQSWAFRAGGARAVTPTVPSHDGDAFPVATRSRRGGCGARRRATARPDSSPSGSETRPCSSSLRRRPQAAEVQSTPTGGHRHQAPEVDGGRIWPPPWRLGCGRGWARPPPRRHGTWRDPSFSTRRTLAATTTDECEGGDQLDLLLRPTRWWRRINRSHRLNRGRGPRRRS